MKNKIEDLRNHLFAALEGLADTEKPMELDRARAIADVGRVIIDSAKAEVEFLKVTGATTGTGFIPAIAPARGLGAPAAAVAAATPLRVCDFCGLKTQQDPCDHCGNAWKRSA